MEHGVVVVAIGVVLVFEPVGRAQVYLHIASPYGFSYLHFGVEEVGPGVVVVQSRVEHLHAFAVFGLQQGGGEQLVLPHVVEQFFHLGFSFF